MNQYHKFLINKKLDQRIRSRQIDKSKGNHKNAENFKKYLAIYQQNSIFRGLMSDIESSYTDLLNLCPDLDKISEEFLENIQQDMNQIIKRRMRQAFKKYLKTKYNTLQQQVDDVQRFDSQISDKRFFSRGREIPELLKKFKQISWICNDVKSESSEERDVQQSANINESEIAINKTQKEDQNEKQNKKDDFQSIEKN